MRSVALTLRREDGRIVCESVRVADTLLRRMRGLLGRRQLSSREGMLLRPAWSIHTAFMHFPIDAVFLDPEQVVIRIDRELGPFKTASCRGAREVVELRAGECTRRGLEVGDRVAWAARSADESAMGDTPVGLHEPHGSVLVVSGDARFAKLTRFLLDGRGIGVAGTVQPDRISTALADEPVDVLLLDAGQTLGDGLRLANVTRAQRPEIEIVLVGEKPPAEAPTSLRVYDKWNETEEAMSAIELALERRQGQIHATTGAIYSRQSEMPIDS